MLSYILRYCTSSINNHSKRHSKQTVSLYSSKTCVEPAPWWRQHPDEVFPVTLWAKALREISGRHDIDQTARTGTRRAPFFSEVPFSISE